MARIEYGRSLDLRRDVDVFVAGGGPAGCAAAVAAARQGARVFLAESQGCLGGQGTAGLVPAFMQFGDGEHFLADGLGREFLDRMAAYGGREGEAAGTWSIRVEALKRTYDDTLLEAGVEFTLHTQLVDVLTENGRITGCVLAGKTGLFAVGAKVYIDGTGDGDLACWAGAPWEKGDDQGRMMAGTLCSLWAGINWEKVRGPDDRCLPQAIADGVFSQPDLHLPGMWRISDTLGGGNIGHTFGVDGTDEASLTRALVHGRKLYDEYETYYKKYLAGYEAMELVTTAGLLGIRESRRIRGLYRLELQDFIERADFDDEVGRYCYCVDIHASDNSAQSYEDFHRTITSLRYRRGESYGVPYRVLVPQGVDNLLVAGRCVSSDRAMQSSLRVMPGCYITGQAAGVAAALCARQGCAPADAPVRQIQRVLKDMGQYLPNYNPQA